jgi:sterol 3beta-glucosyltransferase
MPAKRSIVMCCMGTRGDVQPFVALGLGMFERGWDVTIAAPAEFQGFVESYGIMFADIGRSLQREMLESPEGKALRTVGPLGMRAAARAFFSVDLFSSW